MFRHVVVFKFTPETTRERQEELARQLRTLPGTIPEIKDYHVGLDAGLNPDSYQFAVVADFDNEGYKLVGGRADYFDHQRAAVVVYQHGAHVINVFTWAATNGALPKDTTRDGYHLAFWKTGNLVYCAVSDTAWDELLGLAKLLQNLSAHDIRE